MDANALPPLHDLYRHQRQRALVLARRIVHDDAEAEDVLHDVFVRLLSRQSPYEGRALPSTWLHRVMVNASINALRSNERRGRLETPPAEVATPEQHAASEERHAQFLRALSTLRVKHRQVLILRELRGLAYPDIAKQLGVPIGTVKSTLNRARAHLTAALRKHALAHAGA